MDFKVGDKVRMIKQTVPSINKARPGDVGEIVKTADDDTNCLLVRFKWGEEPVMINEIEHVLSWENLYSQEMRGISAIYERLMDDALFSTNFALRPTDINSQKKGKNIMTRLSNIAKKLLSADVKTLIEAGYLDSELDLTEEGEAFVMAHYLNANMKELAAEAKKELKDKKEE